VYELKAEVAGNSPCLLERLLADRIGTCWLQTQYADIVAAMLKNASVGEHTVAQRRQTEAQKRFLQAIKTLAVVRRYLRPSVSQVVANSRDDAIHQGTGST